MSPGLGHDQSPGHEAGGCWRLLEAAGGYYPQVAMADVFKTQLREQQRRKEMELETRAREKLELARVISTVFMARYLQYLRLG